MVMRSSRTSEEAYLLRLLGECDGGRPQVVSISGAVAIGKTELLQAFLRHATDSGALVLSAVARPGERNLPLGALAQLLDRPGIPESIREHLAASRTVVADQPTYGTCTHPRSLLQDAALLADEVAGLLTDLGGWSSVIVAIDDLQHLDCMSLQVLMQVLRRLDSGRVLVVFTEDAMVVPTHPVLRADIGGHPGYSQIDLAPLDIDDIADILSEVYDPAVVADLAGYYLVQTGGAPLLVRALLDDHGGTPIMPDIDEPAAGPSFRGGVLAICMRWDEATTAVAQAAAVLGDRSDAGRVARVLPTDLEQAKERLTALTATGLVTAERMLRSVRPVVLWNTGDQTRFDLRLRASRLLGSDSAGARPSIPEPWSIDAFTEAAREAELAHDPEHARRLLGLAVGASDEPARRTALTVDLVRLQWRSDPARGAEHLDDLLAGAEQGVLAETDAVSLARWLTWCGRFGDADRVVGNLLAAGDPVAVHAVADLAALVLLHGSVLPSADRWFAGITGGLPQLVQPPVDTRLLSGPGADSGRFGLVAVAALDSALRHGDNALAVGHAEQVLANLPIDDETFESIVAALRTLVLADRLGAAAQWTHVFLSEARARLAGYWQAVLSGIRAEIHLRTGDLVAALEWAERAIDLLGEPGWGVAVGQPLAVGLQASAIVGGPAQAQWLGRSVPEAMFDTYYGSEYLAARADAELALGWVDEAAADVERAAALSDGRFHQPTTSAVRFQRAAVALARGDQDSAVVLLGEQLAMPGAGAARVRGTSLRLLAQALAVDARSEVLTEAASLLAQCGDRFEQALALAGLGEAHLELGRLDAAALVLAQAVELAGKCGATDILRRLRVQADLLQFRMDDAEAGADHAEAAALDTASFLTTSGKA